MKKLLAFVRIGVLDSLEYRIDVLSYIVGGLARPLILLVIWLVILSSPNSVPASKEQLSQYYILLIFVSMFVSAWGAHFISKDIRLGAISPLLLKPISFLLPQLGNNIGEKSIKMIYLIPFLAFISAFLGVKFANIGFVQIILFFISLIFAAVLNFLINTCIGLLAFWTSESDAVDDFMDLLLYFFSGRLFPLFLLPPVIQQISIILPFRYTLYFPIEILSNTLSTGELISGFLWQSIWLAAFFVLYKLCWKHGIKRYSASGA